MVADIELRVSPNELTQLADSWRQQEFDLRSAGELLTFTDSAGFGDDVRDGVRRFLAAWATETRHCADEIRGLATGLAATGAEFAEVDGHWGSRGQWPQ
jgi:hypothetical protein